MSMTPRERVLKALNHKEVDKVPKSTRYTPGILKVFNEKVNANIPERFLKYDSIKPGFITNEFLEEEGVTTFEDYFDIEFRYVDFKAPREINDFTPYHPGLPENAKINEWGIAEVPGKFEHYVEKRFPLAAVNTLEEMKKYPLPNPMESYRHEHLDGVVNRWHEKGYAVAAAMQMTIFEQAWYMRGLEDLFVDMMTDSKALTYLLDRIVEIKSEMAKRYAEADVDVIRLGDDLGSQNDLMMSVDLWRKWLKPRLGEVIKAARSVKPDVKIFYHTDGKVDRVIPELIEVGVDILNPVQPECMDVYELHKEYGKDLCFWGTIGTQSTMPHGTPEDVKQVTIERIEKIGRYGGLVLGPSHKLQPDVPWENVAAFFNTMNTYEIK